MTAAPTDQRTVVVWKTIWLKASETFIRNQLDRLTSWRGVGSGLVEVDSPLVLHSDTILLPGSGVRQKIALRVLQMTGHSRALQNHLRTTDADLVHAHFAGNGFAVQRAAKRVGVPFVVTIHGSDVTATPNLPGIRGTIYRRRLRSLFRNADLLIPVSKYLAGVTTGLGADPTKVRVHYIGVPLSKTRADLDAPKDIDVLFVGRLVEKKGVDHLIRALAAASGTLGPVRTVIVGDGPLLPELGRLAAAEHVEVEFLGSRDNAFVREAMSRSKVLMVPSVTASNGDTEGLPTVVLEAGASGLPVVGYAHSGIPEAVVNGRTGLLATEGDIEGLSRHLMTALTDEPLRRSLAEAAVDHIHAHFDIDTQTAGLEVIYDEVVGTVRPTDGLAPNTSGAPA